MAFDGFVRQGEFTSFALQHATVGEDSFPSAIQNCLPGMAAVAVDEEHEAEELKCIPGDVHDTIVSRARDSREVFHRHSMQGSSSQQ